MEENLEGIQRPVYRNLRIIWQVQVIGFVFSFFDNILVTVAGIVLLIVRIVQVRALADVSDGMARAYRVLITGLALTVGCSLLGLLAFGSILSVIFALAALAGAIVLLVADYYFFFRTGRLGCLARLCLSAGSYQAVFLAVADWRGGRRNHRTVGGGLVCRSMQYCDNGYHAGAALAVP